MKKENLKIICDQIAACKSCKLHETRNKTVPGEGDVNAKVMLIGEGPGAEEDQEGRPFVGRAGKLLEKILNSAGFKREDVFITNIVKCRPPNNRNPEQKEMKACSKFIDAQIAIINPKIIVTVGSISTKALISDLIGSDGITKLRGRIFDWRGIKVVPILHPSYLLRNPSVEEGKPKWHTWKDMLMIKELINKP
tara:strand:- start:10919 stop:11500 length:582 start_codon:yes stop_codon:yes gene_type:complete